MTPLTAVETVEAVAKFLQDEREFLPDNLSPAEAYAWAIFKVRCLALNMRLTTPKPSLPPPQHRDFATDSNRWPT